MVCTRKLILSRCIWIYRHCVFRNWSLWSSYVKPFSNVHKSTTCSTHTHKHTIHKNYVHQKNMFKHRIRSIEIRSNYTSHRVKLWNLIKNPTYLKRKWNVISCKNCDAIAPCVINICAIIFDILLKTAFEWPMAIYMHTLYKPRTSLSLSLLSLSLAVCCLFTLFFCASCNHK